MRTALAFSSLRSELGIGRLVTSTAGPFCNATRQNRLPVVCNTSALSRQFSTHVLSHDQEGIKSRQSSEHCASLYRLPPVSHRARLVRTFSTTSFTMNGANATSPRAKRKPSLHDAIESGRPSKHHRLSLNGKQSAGDNTPDVQDADLEMRDDYIEEVALQPPFPAVGPDTAEWQQTIENVVRNVVSIRFCQTCSFDTDPALNSEATGFVVDAERGYILTNRHVVGAGPFWGFVIFDNHEEVDAYPVYRDPVHDFGILKFDPKAIKYMPVKALTLRPDLAKGGLAFARQPARNRKFWLIGLHSWN